MQTLLPPLIVFTGSGGGPGGALAACEEAFRATSHSAHQEVRQQAERKMPTGSPRPKK
ncbi:hypothetical protein ACGF3G_18200 [Streptomyces sp. NPDC048179]|uniref:hypothetical protein n=1 Tax=Streptomyces sp. NPDC048179 TaxID=3365506 RepID=UPI003721F883